jgi:hypothetical protein
MEGAKYTGKLHGAVFRCCVWASSRIHCLCLQLDLRSRSFTQASAVTWPDVRASRVEPDVLLSILLEY